MVPTMTNADSVRMSEMDVVAIMFNGGALDYCTAVFMCGIPACDNTEGIDKKEKTPFSCENQYAFSENGVYQVDFGGGRKPG